MRCALILLPVLLALAACSRERADWRVASGADTLEAYDRFVRAHPDGELAAEARSRIAQLGEARDWQRALAADSAQAYRDFLAQHPSGLSAETARIRIDNAALAGGPAAARAPPEAAGGADYAIQLGAFSNEARASEAWQRLAARHAGELQGLKPRVIAGSAGVYRLQAPVGEEARARARCAQLKAAGEACVVVPPPR